MKHAQTLGMAERTHAKLKKIPKISVNGDRPQCDRYVDIAKMAKQHDIPRFVATFSNRDLSRKSPVQPTRPTIQKLEQAG